MKAIGRNLIIQAVKQGVSETKGGLLLAEKQREDIRYEEATVISAGNEVLGIKKGNIIYFHIWFIQWFLSEKIRFLKSKLF